MTDYSIHISQLLQKHMTGALSEQEQMELSNWLDKDPANKQLFDFLADPNQIKPELRKMFSYDKYGMAKKIKERSGELFNTSGDLKPTANSIENSSLTADLHSTESTPNMLSASSVHRIHFVRRGFLRYAAAILLILGTLGTFLYLKQQIKSEVTSQNKSDVTSVNPVPLKNDVAPGGNKAILTLADGSAILLDSGGASGQLARQGNVQVVKLANGQISYRLLNKQQDNNSVTYNTMTTPRGGQYKLRLSDGTNVWLNAASSITYPTAFVGKERNVSIKGEAYFEVAKNDVIPFTVKANAMTIEVVGTHFNVNGYEDEPSIKTTLFEGSVKVSGHNNTKMLFPGQQSDFNRNGQLIIIPDADTQSSVAWKNGVFEFNKSDIQMVMRQIARWYDVEISYNGKIPERRFGGKIYRNSSLLEVLKILEESNVHFKLEDKKIIVSP